ncbi:MmcQ/YjbR family DNA-binding protein [Flavobacterium sp. FlaQc-52]|jgi:predicted DNA-binding protein (MmcQ/YjbR family)|uniref:MmcQ/YjbR family DNA-binding protein n=1 Tax=Flavobacterium cupriresistens TaxID=2893885 RepID=A0ABU4RJM5_9FLAO|nr:MULTISPECIES: MmcQ/YjbR family DNA-binding protein [unclassified Flavobacterium]MDX6190726.1 MmcQ/YjbR family DNA-binding protein [Flavobacterium sp. Fl-318]UFH44098.1 MmcQ/YjbR family DNA-binding protein [Flavobacterium sp. F-323]
MITIEAFRTLALALPEATEEPHFEKISFRIKKKIFATIDEKKNLGVFKFNEIDQSVFCASSEMIFYPIPNKWGKQGWTFVDLAKVPTEMFEDALSISYNTVAPKKR